MTWIVQPILIAAALAGFYAGLSLLYYSLSGWRQLRKIYGTALDRPIVTWPFQSATMVAPWNLAGYFGIYRNSLVFGYAEHGVYMSGMFPFILFHKPLLIPWEDVVLTRIDNYCLSSLRLPEVFITVSSKVYYGLIETGRVIHRDGLDELTPPYQTASTRQ